MIKFLNNLICIIIKYNDHDFIKMIDNIDFLYEFIYECANLKNNLYDYDNYNHLDIKLYNEFIMPIINIIKT